MRVCAAWDSWVLYSFCYFVGDLNQGTKVTNVIGAGGAIFNAGTIEVKGNDTKFAFNAAAVRSFALCGLQAGVVQRDFLLKRVRVWVPGNVFEEPTLGSGTILFVFFWQQAGDEAYSVDVGSRFSSESIRP